MFMCNVNSGARIVSVSDAERLDKFEQALCILLRNAWKHVEALQVRGSLGCPLPPHCRRRRPYDVVTRGGPPAQMTDLPLLLKLIADVMLDASGDRVRREPVPRRARRRNKSPPPRARACARARRGAQADTKFEDRLPASALHFLNSVATYIKSIDTRR